MLLDGHSVRMHADTDGDDELSVCWRCICKREAAARETDGKTVTCLTSCRPIGAVAFQGC